MDTRTTQLHFGSISCYPHSTTHEPELSPYRSKLRPRELLHQQGLNGRHLRPCEPVSIPVHLRPPAARIIRPGHRGQIPRLSSKQHTHKQNKPNNNHPTKQDQTTTNNNPVNFAWPTDHAPVPSMLTSLHLCFVREGHLGRILSATKGLKALSWEWHYREDLRGPMDSGIIDLERIAKDLCCVRTTLTDLKILASTSLSRRGGHFSPKVATRGSMSRIVDFVALQ